MISLQVALQTAGIVSGLPYTLIIFMLCLSIWREVQVAFGDLDPFGPQFKIGLFDPLGAEPLKVLRKKPKEALTLFLEFLKNILLAPWTIAKAAHRLAGKKNKIWVHALATVPFFLLAILLHLLELAAQGCWAIGWFWYLCFAVSATGTRLEARRKLEIHGNVFEDFFATVFFYPCVAVQLDMSTRDLDFNGDEKNLEIVCGKIDLDETDKQTKGQTDGNINLAYRNTPL